MINDPCNVFSDLYPGDLADLASSISKYPWKAIVMLADELKVKSHIQKPKEEKIRTWMVMEMLMEWEREYKHDKSPKKTLAQKLHVVSEKWGELNYEFNEDEPHPKFKQLARNLDIQGKKHILKEHYNHVYIMIQFV